MRLAVVGEVAAGHEPAVRVEPGTAVRILTGAMLPPGADAVVPGRGHGCSRRVCQALPDVVAIHVAAASGAHIRRAGSDIRQGEPLLPAGTRIGPAAVAALVATGHVEVEVHRRPRVAIMATGDELRPLGEPLGPASIPDSNSESIAAQVLAAGAEPVRLGIAIDDAEAVRERIVEGILAADVLVATGGVSVGARDVVKEVFEEVGSLDLWRVAIQPGKPLAYGSAVRPDGGTCLLFGLPGNPVSSFVTFELFVRPVLRRLRGEAPDTGTPDRPRRAGRAGHQVGAASGLHPRSPLRGTRRDRPLPCRAGRWAGLARAVRARRRQRPGHHPARAWPACRPEQKWRSSGLTSRSRDSWPGQPKPGQTGSGQSRKPTPSLRQERRRLTHVDRLGRPRMVDVTDKPATSAARRGRGDRQDGPGDAHARHRRRRPQG